MHEIDIVQVIPVGHENALTGRRLARMLGVNQRTVREMISKARKRTAIINMQDGAGYFLPTEDDVYMVKRWFRQESHRKKEIERGLRGARKFLEDMGDFDV